MGGKEKVIPVQQNKKNKKIPPPQKKKSSDLPTVCKIGDEIGNKIF